MALLEHPLRLSAHFVLEKKKTIQISCLIFVPSLKTLYKVEWRNALVEEMEGMTRTIFLCRKADGTYDVFSRIHERIIKFDSAERINIKYVLRYCFVSFPLIL